MFKNPIVNEHVITEVAQLNQQFIGQLLANPDASADPIFVKKYALLLANKERVFAAALRCPFLIFRPADLKLPVQQVRDSDRVVQPPTLSFELSLFTLTFIRQLAREDCITAQLVCGASKSWCEKLGSVPLNQIGALAARTQLHPRLLDIPGFWREMARPQKSLTALQKSTLGVAGLQIILSRAHQQRRPPFLSLESNAHELRGANRVRMARCTHSISKT